MALRTCSGPLSERSESLGGRSEASSLSTDDATDRLVERVAEGDEDALRELYRQYSRLAFAVSYRILRRDDQAEDAVQEAFLRVWRHAARFDSRKASFSTWFGRLVRNLCIDMLRRKDPLNRAGSIDGLERTFSKLERFEPQVLDRITVREAFLQLPEEQVRVLEMAYFGGLTHREIAKELKIPEGTVKSRMRLGLEKLRAQMVPDKAAEA